MDIKDIKYFVAVYEQAGFARAARMLHTVQSNVTTRIRKLEDDIGLKLFERTKRRFFVTAAGEVLYQYSKKMLALEEETLDLIRKGAAPTSPLRLGSMESTAAVRLPDLLTSFHEAYPLARFTLATAPSADLVKRVLDHELDAAFIGGYVANDSLLQDTAFVEELMIIGPRQSRFRSFPQDLKRSTLLVFRAGCSYRKHLEVYLASSGVFPAQLIELGTLDGILGCVAAGMGISMLPRSIVENSRLRDKLHQYPLPAAVSRIPTIIIRLKDSIERPALKAFLRHLDEHRDKTADVALAPTPA